MLIKERGIEGVFEIQLEPHEDERGFFMRTYDDQIFRKYGIHRNWIQENHSLSMEEGVIRGMHFQLPPHTEAKLVRVIRGEIHDVFIDLRKGSATLGQWSSINLSAVNKKMIYIPRGFAHGFCTLTGNCELLYKMDNYYDSASAGTIRWNDLDLGIVWPVNNPILSEKDSKAKSFREFIDNYGGLEV
ncbi:MAG: dTDP-4-dehydrorhamnose 3,5-epimerase [Candidatus Altiarchaeota archaeon]|nr:dTDP-4-dehydrorhamnose 3,5-epimerase [Candidatus Altiarchaeota archaeon]